jgi:hypothetical protein
MATYFHVAPADYDGGPLLSFDEQEARGRAPVWKWDCEMADTDVVCLYSTEAEAREHIEVFQPDGVLLKIEIDDDDDRVSYTKVSEGYTAIYRIIPTEYISRV